MSTEQQILIVEDAFEIRDRGAIVTGVVEDNCILKIGYAVKVVRPDGTEIQTVICGVDAFTKCFSERNNVGIMLGKEISKSDVPRGSIVFML